MVIILKEQFLLRVRGSHRSWYLNETLFKYLLGTRMYGYFPQHQTRQKENRRRELIFQYVCSSDEHLNREKETQRRRIGRRTTTDITLEEEEKRRSDDAVD